MKPFPEFWKEVVSALQKPKTIRNWTAREGYSIGGKFQAVASSQEWIVCSRIEGKSDVQLSFVNFQDCYQRWPNYRANIMNRKAFAGDGAATGQLISILREFDYLLGLETKIW